MAEDVAGELIELDNELRDKAGPPPTAEELRVLARAEEAMAKLGDKYVVAAVEDSARLQKALAALRANPTDPKALDGIFQIAHDMKGQGGSFGFPLVTTIGYQLCRFIEKIDHVGPHEMEAIALHVEAMAMVVRTPIKGDGGQHGEALMNGLDLILKKFSE